MKRKKENIKFSTGNPINKVTIPFDWKNRIKNFQSEATWNVEHKYWYAYYNKLKQKKYSPKSVGYGKPNQQYYPPQSIIKSDNYGQAKIWIIEQKDIELGMHFFKNNYQESYIEKLSGLNVEQILQKIKNSTNFTNIDYLKIKANCNLFTLDISEIKPFEENTIHIWSNLLFSLERVFNKKITNLEVKKWNVSNNSKEIENYLLDWEIKLISSIEQEKIKKDKKVDVIYKSIKFIRNICAHYDSYYKTESDKNYYILISTYIKKEYIYLLCIKINKEIEENQNLIILEYNFNNIKQVTDNFISDIFS